MTSLKRALFAGAFIAIVSAPAEAQVIGRPLEFSAGAGYFAYDTRARVDDGLALQGRLGWRAYPWLTLEAHGTFGPSSADTFPAQDHNLTLLGADLRWNLRPPEGRGVPFLITGIGWARSHTFGRPPDNLDRGSGKLGIGFLYSVMPRAQLRLQAEDIFFRERDAVEFSNHFAVTAALQLQWGGRYLDRDFDGVRDWLDKCPDTPIGATVDGRGCPSDADRDSVFDGIDQCANTPVGCVVDEKGCPLDADGDGVCDGIDQCADTPPGKEVDRRGCPVDLDGDGVKTPNDRCEDTPPGCTVDATGCSTDSDGDGVCDGVDECPNTPAGAEVSNQGCPTRVSAMEQGLIDQGLIRTGNVSFAPGKSVLQGDATFAVLDSIGIILQQYTTLQFEIGGHTDSQGAQTANEKLSSERAQAVHEYLRSKFPRINLSNLSVLGYGPAQPVAPNTTPEGRALNRRVEIKVLNVDALEQIRERRRLMKMLENQSEP